MASRKAIQKYDNTSSRGLVFRILYLAILSVALFGLSHPKTLQAEEAKKEPLSIWSKQWLDEVVPYIITSEEKEYFLSLSDEAERGQFMLRFWKVRDPDSGADSEVQGSKRLQNQNIIPVEEIQTGRICVESGRERQHIR